MSPLVAPKSGGLLGGNARAQTHSPALFQSRNAFGWKALHVRTSEWQRKVAQTRPRVERQEDAKTRAPAQRLGADV